MKNFVYSSQVIGKNVLKNPLMVVDVEVFPFMKMAMSTCFRTDLATFTHSPYQVMRTTCNMPAGMLVTCKYSSLLWQGMHQGKNNYKASELFGDNPLFPLDRMPYAYVELICSV